MSGLNRGVTPNRDVSWAKTSFSFANGNCVEVADLLGEHVGVGHSTDPNGLVLRLNAAWVHHLQ